MAYNPDGYESCNHGRKRKQDGPEYSAPGYDGSSLASKQARHSDGPTDVHHHTAQYNSTQHANYVAGSSSNLPPSSSYNHPPPPSYNRPLTNSDRIPPPPYHAPPPPLSSHFLPPAEHFVYHSSSANTNISEVRHSDPRQSHCYTSGPYCAPPPYASSSLSYVENEMAPPNAGHHPDQYHHHSLQAPTHYGQHFTHVQVPCGAAPLQPPSPIRKPNSKRERPHEILVGRPDFAESRPRCKPRDRFTDEDNALLKELKEKHPQMSWAQIRDFFPGRAPGTLQVRYCTKLNERATTEEQIEKLPGVLEKAEIRYWSEVVKGLGSGMTLEKAQEMVKAVKLRQKEEREEEAEERVRDGGEDEERTERADE